MAKEKPGPAVEHAGLKIEGANEFSGFPQLDQWEAIVSGLGKNGFIVERTTIREQSPGCGKAIITDLRHSTGDYTLDSSCIGWRKDGGLNVMRIDFKRPLSLDLGFTRLPESTKPHSVSLFFDQAEYPAERAQQIRQVFTTFGQQEVSTDQVSSRSEIEGWELRKNAIRMNFAFVTPTARRNCSFEMEAQSTEKELFEQGFFPYHVDQTRVPGDQHYCITSPRLPLIPVAVDERVNRFTLFYSGLQSLPNEEYQRLFQGLQLPAGFSIYYGGNPSLSIYARVGLGVFRDVLGMDILASEGRYSGEFSRLNPRATVKTIVDNLDLYNQFYNGFQTSVPLEK